MLSNLFNKQPGQYDVVIGLDGYQIHKILKKQLSSLNQNSSNLDKKYKKIIDLNNKEELFWAYDEAPLTFFMRDISQNEFEDLRHFMFFLKSNNLSVAVPLKTTSVLGALFEDWVSYENKNSNEILNKEVIKYVKSWSEAFGLFERKIVDGFLSFETSQIYFDNIKNISKINLDLGHPNLIEYLAFSASSKMSDLQKIQFIEFIYSKEIQKLILEKNYMWPISYENHEYLKLRTLKTIQINSDEI